MKICILTTGHPPLDNRIFYKQALSLKKKYQDITLIAPSEQEETWEQGIRILGVKRAPSLYGRFKLGEEVVRKGIEVGADIYHFHDFELIYNVLEIKKALPQAKIIYDVHEHYPDMMRLSQKIPAVLKPLATLFVDKSELYYAKKFDFIITADDAVKERFMPYNPNVEVIYNFTDFIPREEPAIRKIYDVIYQGGITLERGILKDIQAIEIVKAQRPDVRMILVGPFHNPAEQAQVEEYIDSHGLRDNVICTGPVPRTEVEDFVRQSKIGIVTLQPVPKYFKNIPIKQFEYMGCGIPVVGSDLPPIKRFVEKYNCGIIVDPTDPQAIAAAISRLLDSPELRQQLGQNGIRAVTEEYNWSRMEQRLWAIYERLS